MTDAANTYADRAASRMGWEALSQTAEFAMLTPKEKLFVCTYISNDYNVVHAIRTAYKCKNDKNAEIMSYPLLRRPQITTVLMIHFGDWDPEQQPDASVDAFTKRLARDIIRGRIDETELKALRLLAEIKGWYKSPTVKALEVAQELGYSFDTNRSAEPRKQEPKVDMRNLKKAVDIVLKNKRKTGRPKKADANYFQDDESEGQS
jgi:hypothetical protein